jgi:hypothetical protein
VSFDALAECVLADEEGQGLGVGSAIGNGAVAANAGVGEGILEVGSVAIFGGQQDGRENDTYLITGVDAGRSTADLGAAVTLTLTPRVWQGRSAMFQKLDVWRTYMRL